MNIKDKKFLIISLAICLSGIIIFYLLPFIMGFLQTFIADGQKNIILNFDKYIKTFKNESFKIALKNTVIFTLTSVASVNLLSFGSAFILNKLPGKGIYIYGLILPLSIPVIASVSSWKYIIESISANLLYSKYTIIIIIAVYIWRYMGFHMLIYLSGIRSVPKSQIESAVLDGASKFQCLRFIIIPEITSFTVFNLIFSVIHSFKIFRDIYMLFGNYPPENAYLLQHFIQNNFKNLNYDFVLCGSYIFAIAIFVIFVPLQLMGDKGMMDVKSGN